jgi:hypothetical protein
MRHAPFMFDGKRILRIAAQLRDGQDFNPLDGFIQQLIDVRLPVKRRAFERTLLG